MLNARFFCILSIFIFSNAFGISAGPSEYGGDVLADAGGKLRDLLNGPIRGIIALCGAFIGITRAVQTQSLSPLIVFGGIGVGFVIVPQIIDKVFAILI